MIALDKVITFRHIDRFGGPGYIAGEPPPDPNPLELDGRTRVLGQLSPVRVTLMDSVTLRIVATTFSGADGTYRIDGVKPGHRFLVMFQNPGGHYKVQVGAEMLPVNSFVQDFIYAQPYAG